MAGGRRIDVQALREIGQQAHRGEFGGADGEGADRQREQHQAGRTVPGWGSSHGVIVEQDWNGLRAAGPQVQEGL
ncbi:hypothetical protein BPNSA17_37030 [Bordetella petrii]